MLRAVPKHPHNLYTASHWLMAYMAVACTEQTAIHCWPPDTLLLGQHSDPDRPIFGEYRSLEQGVGTDLQFGNRMGTILHSVRSRVLHHSMGPQDMCSHSRKPQKLSEMWV